MSYKFEVGKEYRTRDGRRAVVLSDAYPCFTKRGSSKSLVGVIEVESGWMPWSWNPDDYTFPECYQSCDDLMPPAPREWWVREHDSGSVYGRKSWRESAMEQGKGWGPIFKVRVVFDDEAGGDA